MKKDDIKKALAVFSSSVENGTAEINIMLVDQNNQRKKRYKGFMLKTKLDDIKSVLIHSFNFLSEELDKKNFR